MKTLCKKILALVLVVMLLLTAVACGEDSDNTDPGSKQPTSSNAEGNNSESETSSETTSSAGNAGGVTNLVGTMGERIPASASFDISTGKWTDHGTYGCLFIEGVDEEDIFEYQGTELANNEFYAYSGDTAQGDARKSVFSRTNDETGEEEFICLVEHQVNKTLAIIVYDEWPHSYYIWKCGGLTDEEIGPVQFEGALDDHIPYENQSDIGLYFCDGVGHRDKHHYRVCEVDEARWNSFVNAMAAEGYKEVERAEQDNGMLYYKAAKQTEKDIPAYAYVQILWDQKERMAFNFYGRERDKIEMNELVSSITTEDFTENGRDPEADKPVINLDKEIDLNKAVVEELGNSTAYILDNLSMDAVFSYIQALKNDGYRECEAPYYADIPTNLGPDEPNMWLHKDGMGEQSYIAVAGNGFKNRAIVLMAGEPIQIQEFELWLPIGIMVQAGIGYLETVVENYVQDYGCTGFGRGWDSSGFISYYGSGYGQDDLQWNETNLLNAGFTKKNEFTENGVQHIIYEREEWGGYQSFNLYARLSMVGDFLQIEFGFGTRTDMHDD